MEYQAVTMVIGASDRPERYSYKAVKSLRNHHHPVIAVGKREGQIDDVKILTGKPELENVIDTVTLYINELNQEEMIDYILSLKPRRIIFNPGAENPLLEKLAKKKGIHTMDACTLVMLSTDQY